MRTINLDIPDELHERVQELAKKNEVSINSLVTTALTDSHIISLYHKEMLETNQKK